MLVGELGETLSVSWPEAPPGHRRCRLDWPKRLAVLEICPIKDPMVRIQDTIRGTRHDPGLGKHHAQQVGLGLDPRMEPALVAPLLDGTGIAVAVDYGGGIDKLDLAVQAVPAQVHELTAAIVNPRLDGEIHLPRPVLRDASR